LSYIAYGELEPSDGVPSGTPRLRLKVLKLGTDDVQVYADPVALFGWAPASRRLAFVAGHDNPQLLIGQYSGATLPGSIDAGIPISDLRWVNADHYLFVARVDWEQGAQAGSFDLILAGVDGSSTILASAPQALAYGFSN
jgi:hypothetical protein